MTGHQRYSGDKGKVLQKGKNLLSGTEDVGEDSCRCKEVSKKTIPEMLKLMLRDLAFWKKVH